MPMRYDRNLGVNVYDPSGGPNEADQGNAAQALARALGFYNEASDLGTAANFGSPQMAMQALMGLVQSEQQAKQLQNQRDLMAMQQSGNAAVQEARLNQAAQEAAASRAMAKWGKEGDWARYDRQMQTQRDVAESNKLADFMKSLYGEQGKAERAAARNETTLKAAQMGADARRQAASEKPVKFYAPPTDIMLASIQNLKQGWRSNPANKDKPMPPDSSFAAAAFKDYNAKLGIDVSKIGGPGGGLSPQVQRPMQQGQAPSGAGTDTSQPAIGGQAPSEPTAWQRSQQQLSQNFPNLKNNAASVLWYLNPMGANLEQWKRITDTFGPSMFPNEYR